MRKKFTLLLLLIVGVLNNAFATINYKGVTTDDGTNIVLWFEADPTGSQIVSAQLQYSLGGGNIYTGFVSGTSGSGPNGANWRVTIPIVAAGSASGGSGTIPANATSIMIEGAIIARNEYTSFVWSINNNPLPVKLVSFTAKAEANAVVLEWQTSSEINNSHFEVEKSYDAKDFSSIGTVGGKGDSDALVEYSFTDETPQAGNNYYRLRQVDNDGKFEYSKIRSINYSGGTYSIKVEPNPTNDYIVFRGLKNNSSLEVIDTNGIQLYQGTISNGNSDLKLNVSNYHSGLYIIRVVHENKVEIRKFFVN